MVLLLKGSELRGLLSLPEAIDCVERAFRQKGEGRVQMPPKVYVQFERGDFRVMPAYMQALGAAGVKVVNVHPGNPERGLPSVMATILLLDPETGTPLALMDGTWLTAVRTAAASAVATKHLARRDCERLGVIGAGVQARHQLQALLHVRPIREVRVWSRRGARKYAEEMSRLGLDVVPVREPAEAVRGADLLVTATPSTCPLVKSEWVGEGTHINAIGADAPGKQELDPRLLRRAKVVVDDLEQASRSGEINVPLSKGEFRLEQVHAELGEIVAGRKPGRESEDEITVFDSTGLAIQDIAVAWEVYRRAKEKGMGQEVQLIS